MLPGVLGNFMISIDLATDSFHPDYRNASLPNQSDITMCKESSYLLPSNALRGTKTEKKLTSGAPHAYTVVYNSESHWEVLTQSLGSVWPNVLPFCVVNVILMTIVRLLRDNTGYHGHVLTMFFEMGSSGRKFMNFVMAFLVVTRVKMSMDRYNEARTNIGILFREAREVIQNSVVFTGDQKDDGARKWRLEVAYRTLLVLRSAMAVLNFSVREVSVWNLPELNGEEKEQVLRNLLINPENQHYAIDPNTEFEENIRVPNLVAYMLTESIVDQSRRLKKELPLPQEMKLLSSVDSFMGGYYGLRKFLTTPTPFPLIQLTTTFTFFYVFTIPYVLLGDDSGLVAHMFFTFLITMGFIGLNAVAIELDNPFGDDPNDFNNLGLAATANEDTYLTILDIDGKEWADKLRHRMRNHERDEPALSEGDCLLPSVRYV